MPKNKPLSQRQAKMIVKQSMAALGIRRDMKTDPKIIRSVLREMKLNDLKTECLPIKKFLRNATSKPQSLRTMFASIEDGILHKHPAIVEFSQLALKKQWLSPSKDIQRALHVTFVLEAFTAAICNDRTFFREVHSHIRSKEIRSGIDLHHFVGAFFSVLRVTRSIFLAIKFFAVDAATIALKARRVPCDSPQYKRQLTAISKRKGLNCIEYKLLSPAFTHDIEHIMKWMRLNIYEAGVTEYLKGFSENALCAEELSEDLRKNPCASQYTKTGVAPEGCTDPLYASLKTVNNTFPTYSCSQKWVSLYISWNMAFVMGNVDDMDLVMPKLLIPSVINAKTEHFIGVRCAALWLTMNNLLFRKCTASRSVTGPKYKKEMAAAWGHINKKYALELAQREMHETPGAAWKNFRAFFSHPIFHFLKLVEDFAVR